MNPSSEIKIEWIKNVLNEWQEFWPAPATLTSNNAARWLERYYSAVNQSRLVVRYWPEVCNRVYLHCRWFPMPSDLEEIAKEIRLERMP